MDKIDKEFVVALCKLVIGLALILAFATVYRADNSIAGLIGQIGCLAMIFYIFFNYIITGSDWMWRGV